MPRCFFFVSGSLHRSHNKLSEESLSLVGREVKIKGLTVPAKWRASVVGKRTVRSLRWDPPPGFVLGSFNHSVMCSMCEMEAQIFQSGCWQTTLFSLHCDYCGSAGATRSQATFTWASFSNAILTFLDRKFHIHCLDGCWIFRYTVFTFAFWILLGLYSNYLWPCKHSYSEVWD